MKQNLQRTLVLSVQAIILAVLLVACGGGKAKKPEYYDAVEMPELVIPEGLSPPVSHSALVIGVETMPPPSFVMETMPPRISNTTSGIDSNSELNWSSQGLFLMVDDTPDSTQRRLKLVIERAGMQRIRIDEQGVVRFDYYQSFADDGGFVRKMAFWNRNQAEDYSGAYQTFVEPDGDKSRVYIKYADGTDCEPDAAEHVLAVLRERIG